MCAKCGSDKYACFDASVLRVIMTIEGLIWDIEESAVAGIIEPCLTNEDNLLANDCKFITQILRFEDLSIGAWLIRWEPKGLHWGMK